MPLAASCFSRAGPGGPTLDLHPAIDRALACAASAFDGNHFDDEYLKYVYPTERLESPLPGYTLTYRNLDAYFIVRMIDRSGVRPGPAHLMFERTEALLTALAPAWREAGLYNVRKDPVQGGIALDTYAILAYLQADPDLAKVVLRAFDGDGWLREDYYLGSQTFRRVADESWAARAIVVTRVDDSVGAAAVRKVCERARSQFVVESDVLARANLSIHALDALRDLASSAPVVSKEEGEWRTRERRFLLAASLSLLDDPDLRPNTLTLANLVGSLAQEPLAGSGVLDPIVRTLLSRQERDGCWQESLDGPRNVARVFATLRVVLGLQQVARSIAQAGA